MSKFYIVRQNNSGGYWEIDEKIGLGHYLVFEAESGEHFEWRLEKFLDKTPNNWCSCCGERWSFCDSEDCELEGSVDDISLKDKWEKKHRVLGVHYLSGKVEVILFDSQTGERISTQEVQHD